MPHLDSTTICVVFILLSTLVSRASLTLIDLNSSSVTESTNRITPHCFTPGTSSDLGETNLKDCRDALAILARNPDFTTPFHFSKNPRRGIRVPRGWKSGDCLILVSCENDRDAYTFRFADVLVVAKRLVDNCVEGRVSERWGLLRWGGVDDLGASETFYVSVGKPFAPRIPAESAGPVESLNGTRLDPTIDIS